MHEPLSTASEQAGRRATLLTVAAGLTVVIAVAMWLYRQQAHFPDRGPDINPINMAQGPSQERLIGTYRQTDVLSLLAGPQTIGQLLMTTPQDRLLLEEPADLPAYPGGRREAGLRRHTGGIVEETVYWSYAKTGLAELQAFYDKAAIDAGFSPWPGVRQKSEPTVVNRLYCRSVSSTEHSQPTNPSDGSPGKGISKDRPGNQVLLVRAWTLPQGGTQLMLWLRYPQSP